MKLAALALLFAPSAYALCPGGPYPSTDACLTWTAPTQYVGGALIPANKVIAYRVYRDNAEYVTTVTNLYLDLKAEPSGNRCYYVTAVVDGVESAPSAKPCKLIRPAAPTGGSIEAPTQGSFEP
jgi:hypothetical protein